MAKSMRENIIPTVLFAWFYCFATDLSSSSHISTVYSHNTNKKTHEFNTHLNNEYVAHWILDMDTMTTIDVRDKKMDTHFAVAKTKWFKVSYFTYKFRVVFSSLLRMFVRRLCIDFSNHFLVLYNAIVFIIVVSSQIRSDNHSSVAFFFLPGW